MKESEEVRNTAFEEMHENLIYNSFDVHSVIDKAYSNIMAKNNWKIFCTECLLLMRRQKKNPVHRKIMLVKTVLIENYNSALKRGCFAVLLKHLKIVQVRLFC